MPLTAHPPLIEPAPAAQFNYLLRNDFSFFAQKVFQTVSPSSGYLHNWHIDAIAHHLQLVMQGEITRLIITVPPRYMKSILASVALPAFVLGHDPAAQVISVTYAQELSTKHGNDTRNAMLEKWYRDLFPGTRIEKSTEVELTTTKRGFRLATSVGGVLTGRGGDLIIIDDPVKPQDAMSEVARAKARDWLENTLFTRLNDKVHGNIIVVMQRLHEDDPVGHLLEKGGWTHLNLPAIADERSEILIGPGRYYIRRAGELLHPEREPEFALERMKIDLGSAMFSAQYQQAPVPPEGNLIHWDWFKYYEGNPPFPRKAGDTIFVSWDTAMKANDLADYSVGTVWHVRNGMRDIHLMDVVRERLDFPTLRQRVTALHTKWNADFTLIEDKGSGTALIQDLRSQRGRISVRKSEPIGDKVMRMATASPLIEEGRVYLPRTARWLDAFRSEIMAFPRGRHDDQVDSLSQALEYVRTWSRRRPVVVAAKGLY